MCIRDSPLVHVYRYVTEGTFDAYLWQTVENKQKFISQIMTSKSPVRSCDDVDETALSFAEISHVLMNSSKRSTLFGSEGFFFVSGEISIG